MPFRNRKDLLERCLASLQRQTAQCFEVILVDNGSHDGAEDVAKQFCKLFQDSRLIYSDVPGPGEARNLGAEAASGDYLFFLDSDDWLDANCLQKLLLEAKISDADVVLSGYTRVRPGWKQEVYLSPKLRKGLSVSAQPRILRSAEAFPWGKLFRTQFWKAEKFRFPLIMFEDIALIYKVLERAQSISFVNEPLCFWDSRAPGKETHRKNDFSKIFQSLSIMLTHFRLFQTDEELENVLVELTLMHLYARINHLEHSGSFWQLLTQARMTREFLNKNFLGWSKSAPFRRYPKRIRLSILRPFWGTLRLEIIRKLRLEKKRIRAVLDWIPYARRKGGRTVFSRPETRPRIVAILNELHLENRKLLHFTNVLTKHPGESSTRNRQLDFIEVATIYRNQGEVFSVECALRSEGFVRQQEFIAEGHVAQQTWRGPGQEIRVVFIQDTGESLRARIPVIRSRCKQNQAAVPFKTLFLGASADFEPLNLGGTGWERSQRVMTGTAAVRNFPGNRSAKYRKSPDRSIISGWGEIFRVSRSISP